MRKDFKIITVLSVISLMLSVLATFPLSFLSKLPSVDNLIVVAEVLEQYRFLIMQGVFVVVIVLLVFRTYFLAVLHFVLVIYSLNIITNFTDSRFTSSIFPCKALFEKSISILSYNVYANNKSYSKINAFLELSNADIIILQESKMELLIYLQPHLTAKYPFSYPVVDRNKRAAATLYSRFPINDIQLARLPKSGQFVLHAKILWENDMLNIIGIHPLSPITAQRIQNRNRSTAELADYIRKNHLHDQPLIVAGDFNSVVWHPANKKLMQEHNLKSNTLINYFGTWPTWLPSFLTVPIDHILYNNFFTNAHYSRGIDSGSDHYPVFVQLNYCKPNAD